MEHEEFWLDDVWCIFHHNIDDAVWTYASYNRIAIISSAEEFWSAHVHVAKYLPFNLFFVMREHSFPCWDDASNIDGGCVSVRVPIRESVTYWASLCSRLLCEQIAMDDENKDAINGISASPKHSWCVFKVWLARPIDSDRIVLPAGYVGQRMYKSNRDNIQEDRVK